MIRAKSKHSLAESAGVKAAYKLLPKDIMAAFWLNMETVRMAPGAADVYKMLREPVATVVLGNYLDEVPGRTPFVCGGIVASNAGFLATVRMPRPRRHGARTGSAHAARRQTARAAGPSAGTQGRSLQRQQLSRSVVHSREDRSRLFGRKCDQSDGGF